MSSNEKSLRDIGLSLLKSFWLSLMIGTSVYTIIREARAIVKFLDEEGL